MLRYRRINMHWLEHWPRTVNLQSVATFKGACKTQRLLRKHPLVSYSIWSVACVLWSACADSKHAADRTSDAAQPDAGSDAVHVLFSLGSGGPMTLGTVPWPDDLYLDKQSHVTLARLPDDPATSDYQSALLESLADLDGYGVASPVYFFLDGDIARNSLPQTAEESTGERASVFLIDADTGSPEAFQRVRVESQWLPQMHRLAVRPALGHPLTPGRRYAAIVTRRVRDLSGRSVEAAATFMHVRDTDTSLRDPRLIQARAEYAPVLETLAKAGTPRDEIVALAVFRVQTTTKDFEAARRFVRAGKPPIPANLSVVIGAAGLDSALGSSTLPDSLAAPHEHLSAMLHGTLASPNFMCDVAGTHGAWQRDEAGQLRVKRIDDVPFTLFVPATSAWVPSASPVVIYQHQRGRERSDAVYVANALAAQNIAVLAIDAPFQGLRVRVSDAADGVDVRNRFTGKTGADRFGDQPGDFFGMQDTQGELSTLHPFYARDAMRQGVVDLMTAVRFIEEGDFGVITDLDPLLKTRKFGAARLGFIGEDLGAQLGVVLAPFEPNLQALVLFAVGAGVAQEWWLGAEDAPLFSELEQRSGRDVDSVDYALDSPAFWPEFALFDTLTARAEPLAYAAALRRAPVNTLLLMARDDEVVSNLVTEALAVGLGATFVGGEPRYVGDLRSQAALGGQSISGNFAIEDDRVTRVLQEYPSADHALLRSPKGQQKYVHPPEPPFELLATPRTVDNPMGAAVAQIVEYFRSFFDCVGGSTASASTIKCAAGVTVPAR
jgi:hypothetical protein